MSQEKKSTVGPPIWVESLMTPKEYAETAKKYPSIFSNGSKPPEYNPVHHEGGKWRDGMGKGYTPEEIIKRNRAFDELHKLLKTKQFQNLKPQYGNVKLQ